MKIKQNPYLTLVIFLAVLVLVQMACSLPGQAASKPTITPTQAGKCVVPSLVGSDPAAAEKSLAALGLQPVKTNEYSNSVPAGLISASTPPAGTVLQPCKGDVTIVISLGLKIISTTPPGATVTATVKTTPVNTQPPAATATSTLKPPLPTATATSINATDRPMYTTFFVENFDKTVNGFKPDWYVKPAAGASSAYKGGYLEIKGAVEAYVGEPTWKDYLMTFKAVNGSLYDFTVFYRVTGVNYMKMVCQDKQSTIGVGTYLHCDWYVVQNNTPTMVTGTYPDSVCTGMCDIAVEAKGDEFRFLFNNVEKFKYKDARVPAGSVGFSINSPNQPWRFYTFDVSTLGGGASSGQTLFRDEFKTDEWSVGKTDGELATYERSLVNGKYQWTVKAKDGMVLRSWIPASILTLPDAFTLTVDARMVSGAKDAAYGLVWRMQEGTNPSYYYFRVAEEGFYSFYKNLQGQWVAIAEDAPVQVNKGAVNKLKVVGEGKAYRFFVNDKLLTQISDESLKAGGFGVLVELSFAGDQVTVEFDNLRIMVP